MIWHRTCWEEQYRVIREPGWEDRGETVMLGALAFFT